MRVFRKDVTHDNIESDKKRFRSLFRRCIYGKTTRVGGLINPAAFSKPFECTCIDAYYR